MYLNPVILDSAISQIQIKGNKHQGGLISENEFSYLIMRHHGKFIYYNEELLTGFSKSSFPKSDMHL